MNRTYLKKVTSQMTTRHLIRRPGEARSLIGPGPLLLTRLVCTRTRFLCLCFTSGSCLSSGTDLLLHFFHCTLMHVHGLTCTDSRAQTHVHRLTCTGVLPFRLTPSAQVFSDSRRFYSLSVGVKHVRRPAVHEARVPCEPQRHHQDEEGQDAHLPVAHPSQLKVFLSDELVRGPFFFRPDRPTSPGLPQAEAVRSGAERSRITLGVKELR